MVGTEHYGVLDALFRLFRPTNKELSFCRVFAYITRIIPRYEDASA